MTFGHWDHFYTFGFSSDCYTFLGERQKQMSQESNNSSVDLSPATAADNIVPPPPPEAENPEPRQQGSRQPGPRQPGPRRPGSSHPGPWHPASRYGGRVLRKINKNMADLAALQRRMFSLARALERQIDEAGISRSDKEAYKAQLESCFNCLRRFMRESDCNPNNNGVKEQSTMNASLLYLDLSSSATSSNMKFVNHALLNNDFKSL
ncbi:uncharacterized protein LOC129716887 [Wyeomyia smithii]|uniref:uncharacterized protein LOC129716887 n=1 Tax=Wyeomyia smithii TaxID=174621 RepID=UPI0024680A26|nr:uncharacterized protein LOC129716887 [Wyeomyia smithii]